MEARISALSALAISYLALNPVAYGQYFNFDPDLLIQADSTIVLSSCYIKFLGVRDLDMNGDGIDDFRFQVSSKSACGPWGSLGSGGVNNVARVIPLNSNSIQIPVPGGDFPVPICSSIGPSMAGYNFTTASRAVGRSSVGSSSAGESYYKTFGWNLPGPTKSLGVKVNIGGQEHYGWIRLRANPHGPEIWLNSYYLNPISGTSVVSGANLLEPASIESFSVVRDSSSTSSLPEEQIRVKFSIPACMNPATISEYRLYLDKGWLEPVDSIMASSNYHVVSSTASSFDLVFPAGITDLDGDSIEFNTQYYVHLLAVPSTATFNESEHYRRTVIELIQPVASAIELQLFDHGNAMNTSDFRLKFEAATNETGITHYEVILVRESDIGSFDTEAADNTFWRLVLPIGANFNDFLIPTLRDYTGSVISPGVNYVAYVLSKTDGTLIPGLSLPSNPVSLELAPYPGLPDDDGDDDAMW